MKRGATVRGFGPAALTRRVEDAIAAASAGRSALPPEALAVEGLTSQGVRHLLNNLCRGPGVRYLEIGTYKGSTLVAASYGNAGRFTAVDDFSEFAHMGAREALQAVRARFAAHCRVRFVEGDCWSAAIKRRLPRGVNVYFYDGAHGYRDQYLAFTYLDSLMADTFVAVVDDWNKAHVRAATRAAFAELGHRVVHRRELRTRSIVRGRWWNGLLVAVVRRRRGAR